MKASLSGILAIFLSGSLHAADKITVDADFVQAKSRRALTHDVRKLSGRKGVERVSIPSCVTRAGVPMEIAVTRDFKVRSLAPTKHPLIATGVTLKVTSYVTGGSLSYRAEIKVREYESLTAVGTPPVATFVTREVYASGTPKNGEEVWLDLPNRNGEVTAIRLVFTREG